MIALRHIAIAAAALAVMATAGAAAAKTPTPNEQYQKTGWPARSVNFACNWLTREFGSDPIYKPDGRLYCKKGVGPQWAGYKETYIPEKCLDMVPSVPFTDQDKMIDKLRPPFRKCIGE